MGALTMRAPEVVGGGGFTLPDALLVMAEAGKQLVSAPLTEAITASRLLARLGGDANAMFERIRHESATVTLPLLDAGEQPCQLIAGVLKTQRLTSSH